ncbi:MAG TPA: sialidase family protein [Mycobacteriales bacterium]|jgi:hypothetical protein
MRRRLLVIAAAVGTTSAAAFLPSASPANAAGFGTPVVVSSLNASEPNIDVAPDGTVYINAPIGLLTSLPNSPSVIWRSGDSGATWTQTPFGLRAAAPGGGDSDISVAPDGSLSWTDLWLGSSTVGSSTDKAQSWLVNPVQGVIAQDRQWVAGVGGGIVYHVTHQVPSGITVSKSVDGGLTYPVSVIAATPLDQTGCVCPPGNMVAEPGGLTGDKVGVVYYTSTGGVKFARSTNGGLTFTNTTVKPASSADTGAAFPIVANAGGGKLVAVWQEITPGTKTAPGTSRIGFNSSNDWGATWGTARTIVTSGTSTFPWVDARGGKVAVSLFWTSASGTPDTVPNSAQWFETYLESADGGATFSALSTADPTAVKTGPICTEGTACASDRELGDFQSVALDTLGRANLTWTRSINGSDDTEVRFVRQI